LEREYGDCDEPRPVWYFDPESRACRRFYYSGCGGNGNRFETEDECQSRCLEATQPEDPMSAGYEPERIELPGMTKQLTRLTKFRAFGVG
jgi:hypothetical protein